MATITSNGTGGGPWGTGSTWVGDTIPQNNDTVVIAAGDSVLMDFDTSGWADGVAGLTITGSDSGTPGMLYFANGSDGYLKIKTITTISGTNHTNRARLLANSNGDWAGSTGVQLSNNAIIHLGNGAAVSTRYLDVKLYATHPTNKYVTTYHDSQIDNGYYFEFDAATAVDIVNNQITLPYDPPATNSQIKFKALNGATLPGGLSENELYYTYGVDNGTNKFSPAYLSSTATGIVDITSTGSGTIAVYRAYATSQITQTFSIFEDLASDPEWSSTANFNRVCLINALASTSTSSDIQCGTISSIDTISPYGITVAFNNITTNLDSTQTPGTRMYLLSRNVGIWDYTTATSTGVIDGVGATTGTLVLDCEVTNMNAFQSTSRLQNRSVVNNFNSNSVVLSGIFSCFNYVTYSTTGQFVFSGISISAEQALFSAPAGATLSGTIVGANIGIYNSSSSFIFSGLMFGCGTGISTCSGAFTSSSESKFIGCSDGLATCNGSFVFSGTMYYGINGVISTAAGTYTLTSSAVICGMVSTGIAAATSMAATGSAVLSGVTIRGCYNGIASSTRNKIRLENCHIIHCYYGFYNNAYAGIIMNGGSISYCAQIAGPCVGGIFEGVTLGNSNGGFSPVGFCRFTNCTFDTITSVVFNASIAGNVLVNTQFINCPVGVFGNNASTIMSNDLSYSVSYNHNGVANDTRMFGQCGSMARDEAIFPAGKSFSHKFTYTNASSVTMMEWPIFPVTGATFSIKVYAKQDTTSLAESARIHWALVDLEDDPLIDSSGSYLSSFVASDSTEWQSATLSCTRTTDRPLVLRVWATRGSGSSYVYFDKTQLPHRPLP